MLVKYNSVLHFSFDQNCFNCRLTKIISYIAITNYGPIFVDKFTRCERLLDLYGECLQEGHIYIVCKFRNDETFNITRRIKRC